MQICIIHECNRKVKARNLCPSHYARWQRDGDNFDKTPILNTSVKSRFESRMSKKNNNGCILWTGSMHETGYGKFNWIGGSYMLAHRASYELFVGKIPDKLYVCHKCDIRNCVNPEHLFLGTHLDNMIDRDRKGRNKIRFGADNPATKLNQNQVKEIRLRSNENRHILAKEYNVSATNITAIQVRRIWKHVE
jgi:hypothetical protein